MIEALTDQNLAGKTREGTVLTDFRAIWCRPCRIQSPIIGRSAEEYRDVEFAKVDVDEDQSIAKNLGIMTVPTLIIKKSGGVVGQITGYTPRERLDEILNQYAD